MSLSDLNPMWETDVLNGGTHHCSRFVLPPLRYESPPSRDRLEAASPGYMGRLPDVFGTRVPTHPSRRRLGHIWFVGPDWFLCLPPRYMCRVGGVHPDGESFAEQFSVIKV